MVNEFTSKPIMMNIKINTIWRYLYHLRRLTHAGFTGVLYAGEVMMVWV